MKIELIAAIGENRELALDDQLPWHLPRDLKFFRDQIRGETVVMGRKTFEAMGKVSKNRTYVVITRNRSWQHPAANVVHSLEESLNWCREHGVERCIVLGGGQIYEQALGVADELVLTLIHASFEANVFFPEWDHDNWQEVWREDHDADEDNEHAMSFVRLARKE